MKRSSSPPGTSAKKNESFIPPSVTRTVLVTPKNITPSTKFLMDGKVASKRAEKKLDFRKN